MELHQLKIFFLAAETLKFYDTASRMRLTPSAVSIQIKNLETELGTCLFTRNKGKLLLTEKGHVFYREIAPLFNILEHARSAIRENISANRTRMIISTIFDVDQFYIEHFVAFAKAHPEIVLTILCRSAWETISLVASGQADFGVGRFGSLPKNLTSEMLMEVRPFVIAPRTHPLSAKRVLRLSDLASYPLVVLPRGTSFRSSIERRFRKENLTMQVAIEPATCQDIKRCVSADLGVGILHGICTDNGDRREFRLIDAKRFFGSSPLTIIYRKTGHIDDKVKRELIRHLSKPSSN
ncbi:MAG: LysR family transcriptional regulator [Deltaproteobacteria bacterium]|nr:LysR family transcriptional regulator [Deltaproteobacteria bacterium]